MLEEYWKIDVGSRLQNSAQWVFLLPTAEGKNHLNSFPSGKSSSGVNAIFNRYLRTFLSQKLLSLLQLMTMARKCQELKAVCILLHKKRVGLSLTGRKVYSSPNFEVNRSTPSAPTTKNCTRICGTEMTSAAFIQPWHPTPSEKAASCTLTYGGLQSPPQFIAILVCDWWQVARQQCWNTLLNGYFTYSFIATIVVVFIWLTLHRHQVAQGHTFDRSGTGGVPQIFRFSFL